jgi:hypothetical protein
MVVVDKRGCAFGCYSELPFNERVASCGKRDFLFAIGPDDQNNNNNGSEAAGVGLNTDRRSEGGCGGGGAERAGGVEQGRRRTGAAGGSTDITDGPHLYDVGFDDDEHGRLLPQFERFDWNALTSSRLASSATQLRVSNRRGFDVCIYDAFSCGIRAASAKCQVLASQPPEFEVAAVELWVPASLNVAMDLRK